jgi:hypothetical protein
MSRDSSVDVAVSCRLDDRGSITGSDRDFSLLHRVQTGYGVHPASYPVDTVGPFSGVKRGPSSSEVKNAGDIPPLPYTSSEHGA